MSKRRDEILAALGPITDIEIVHLGLTNAGDATLILLFEEDQNQPSYTLLFDCGFAEAGTEALRRAYWKYMGNRVTIDEVVISHYDKDHMAGVLQGLTGGVTHDSFNGVTFFNDCGQPGQPRSQRKPDNLASIFSAPFARQGDRFKRYREALYNCIKNQADPDYTLWETGSVTEDDDNPPFGWEACSFQVGEDLFSKVDGVSLKVIAVNRFANGIFQQSYHQASNADSIGLLLKFNNFTYYIAGDLEIEQEGGELYDDGGSPQDPANATVMAYLEAAGLIPITCMKLSHHGSKTSSSLKFLTNLNPRAAFISCGTNNSNRHPSPAVIGSLNSLAVGDTGPIIEPAYYLTGSDQERANTKGYAPNQAFIAGSWDTPRGGGPPTRRGTPTRYGDIRVTTSADASATNPATFMVDFDEAAGGSNLEGEEDWDYENYQTCIHLFYSDPALAAVAPVEIPSERLEDPAEIALQTIYSQLQTMRDNATVPRPDPDPSDPSGVCVFTTSSYGQITSPAFLAFLEALSPSPLVFGTINNPNEPPDLGDGLNCHPPTVQLSGLVNGNLTTQAPLVIDVTNICANASSDASEAQPSVQLSIKEGTLCFTEDTENETVVVSFDISSASLSIAGTDVIVTGEFIVKELAGTPPSYLVSVELKGVNSDLGLSQLQGVLGADNFPPSPAQFIPTLEDAKVSEMTLAGSLSGGDIIGSSVTATAITTKEDTMQWSGFPDVTLKSLISQLSIDLPQPGTAGGVATAKSSWSLGGVVEIGSGTGTDIAIAVTPYGSGICNLRIGASIPNQGGSVTSTPPDLGTVCGWFPGGVGDSMSAALQSVLGADTGDVAMGILELNLTTGESIAVSDVTVLGECGITLSDGTSVELSLRMTFPEKTFTVFLDAPAMMSVASDPSQFQSIPAAKLLGHYVGTDPDDAEGLSLDSILINVDVSDDDYYYDLSLTTQEDWVLFGDAPNGITLTETYFEIDYSKNGKGISVSATFDTSAPDQTTGAPATIVVDGTWQSDSGWEITGTMVVPDGYNISDAVDHFTSSLGLPALSLPNITVTGADVIIDTQPQKSMQLEVGFGSNSSTAYAFAGEPSGGDAFIIFGTELSVALPLSSISVLGSLASHLGTIEIDDMWVLASTADVDQADMPSQLPLDSLQEGLSITGGQITISPPGDAGTDGGGTDTTIATPETAPTTTSAGPTFTKNLQKSIGPLHLNSLVFGYEGGDVSAGVNASVELSGFSLSFMDAALTVDVGDPSNVGFELMGLGVDFNEADLVISGALLKATTDKGTEYDGGLVAEAGPFGLSALGAYGNLTGSENSMFAFALIDDDLGGPPYFFIKGLAAGFGYNMTMNIPPVAQLAQFPLIQAAMANQSTFSSRDPVMAVQGLEGAGVIDTGAGDLWLGAGIRFSTFGLVDSFAMVSVSIGDGLQIDLLGLSTIAMPPGSNQTDALVYAELELEAMILPKEGLFAIEAQLTPNSYVLSHSCRLMGGFAFYVWFGGAHEGEFVITLGGYNKHVSVPSYFPKPPRLGLMWQIDDHLSLQGSCYFALSNSWVMVGGAWSITFGDGSLRAWFDMSADFVLSWKPYYYEGDFSFSIGVSYTFHIDLLFTHITETIDVHLGASLTVQGPPFSGKAHVDLWCISFTISFGAQPEGPPPLTWAEFAQAFLPMNEGAVAPYKAAISKGLIPTTKKAAESSDDIIVVDPHKLELTVTSAVPLCSATFQDSSLSTGNAYIGDYTVPPMKTPSPGSTNSLAVSLTPSSGETIDASKFNTQPLARRVADALWFQETPPEGEQTSALVGYVISPNPTAPAMTGTISASALRSTAPTSYPDIVWSTSLQPESNNFTAEQTVENTIETAATTRTSIVNSLVANGLNVDVSDVYVNDIATDGARYFLHNPELRLLGEIDPPK